MSKGTIIAVCAFALVLVSAIGVMSIAIGMLPVIDNFAPNEKLFSPDAIDHDTVLAYEKLGATHGHWWVQRVDQLLLWSPGLDRPMWEGEPPFRDWPGFEFTKLPKEKLPAVDVPFGLNLEKCQVTDAQLQELKQMKNLKLIQVNGQVINIEKGK